MKANKGQQKLYDLVMVNARKVIYGTSAQDNQRFQTLVQKLKAAQGEIGDTIGQTAALILFNVSSALQKAGTSVPTTILFAAGRELVAEIIQIAQTANLLPPGKQAAIEQQALTEGVKSFQRAQTTPQQPAAAPAGAPTQPAPQPAPAGPQPGA